MPLNISMVPQYSKAIPKLFQLFSKDSYQSWCRSHTRSGGKKRWAEILRSLKYRFPFSRGPLERATYCTFSSPRVLPRMFQGRYVLLCRPPDRKTPVPSWRQIPIFLVKVRSIPSTRFLIHRRRRNMFFPYISWFFIRAGY